MKNEVFIAQIKQHSEPSAIAMVYYDGRKMSYETIGLLYDTFKLFIIEHAIHNASRIGVLLEDRLYYFAIGLSVLENMSLVQLEYESDETLLQDISLFRIDYVIVDSLNLIFDELNIGIILFKNNGFSLVRKSNTIMSEYHSPDIAYLSKTSGTTSIPKIVPIEYNMMVYKQNMNVKHFEIDSHTIQIQTVKMSRMISLSNALRVITSNGCVLQCDGINVKEIGKYLKNYTVQFIVMVPAGINQLLNYLDESSEQVSLEHVHFIVGGSTLDHSLAQRLSAYKAMVISYYGMTETGSIASSYHAPKGYKEGSVGWAKLECKIIDEEICCRGEAVFKGYENYPNDDIFIHGWFRTGDIGRIDEDHYIYITGRKSEMINRGGEKISPYEIEALLKKHPLIEDVVVFPYYMDNSIEEVGCAVVHKANQVLQLKDIRLYLKDKINSYKMPTVFYVINKIPISNNNKIQRKSLQQALKDMHIYPENNEVNNDNLVQLSTIETKLLEIFKLILGVKTVSIDDDFFDNGGDSLKANELIATIEKQFNTALPLDLFLANRNVRYLSRILDKKYVHKLKYLIKLNQGIDPITLISVHSGDGVAINYHYLAKELNPFIPVYALELKSKYAKELKEYTIENLANIYLNEIQDNIHGPFILLGDCIGGTLAFELAHQAKLRKMDIRHLIMLDTPQRVRTTTKNRLTDQVFAKVKRNVHKLKGLSLTDKMKHLIMIIGKMGMFMKSWFEKKLIKENQSDKYIKYYNLRTIIHRMIQNYKVSHYPDKLIYIRSIDNRNTLKHLEFWKNHCESLELYEFDCKHDEFLNRKEVKELSKLIKQTIQTVR